MGQKPTLGFSDLAKVSFSTSLLRYPLDGNKKSFPDFTFNTRRIYAN